MNELFGLSMTYIAAGCLAATVAILLFVGFIAVRNPVMFKMGLRNIPRRKAQTALIVVGLMLSTLIMSAAFGTGDTLTSSVTSEVYAVLGEADELIVWDTDKEAKAQDEQVIPLETVEAWQRQFASDPDIEALVPFLAERLPTQNQRSRLNEASARIVAFRASDAQGLGGLKDTDGKPVVLAGNDFAVNKELAEAIDARPGDTVLVFYEGKPVELKVKALVPVSVLGGAWDTSSQEGGAVDFAFLADLTGKGANADGVFVSNRGGARSGLSHSDAAKDKLTTAVGDAPYVVEDFKKDNIRFAELIGNAFTAIFVVFGLFSIAAGILLIFLIFVMLAAERKPEMGMARAVGAKRRQLVESFLAEGMGYDLGSAVVGLFAGMGVTLAMIGIIRWAAGESLGLNLTVTFTLRSMAVAFCLGVMATFLVIFISSWRASRLNITAAIRDLPESKPINPEAATWKGYLRAVLNGVVALALPLGLTFLLLGPVGMAFAIPMILVGLITPWVYMLRGSELATHDDFIWERLPKWPMYLGFALPMVGWFVILPGYFTALGLVIAGRALQPARIPLWLQVAGVCVPPFIGLPLVVLQDARARISWAAGIGSAFGLAGVAMIYGGLEIDSAFFYALGVSLVFLWGAVVLRYFHFHERLTFTTISAMVLTFWYLEAPNKLGWLHHELNGNIEMFFLSGMVMVSCGVFIVVYNADIMLPAVGALGSRFGRIVPAVKTGVAYPLTSRFRTGMTMTMIGLIMFALVMNATINKNFSEVFLNKDTKGGFDVILQVNQNNRIDDLRAALAASGGGGTAKPDVAKIAAVGELRVAYPFEAEVENKDKKKIDGEVKEYSRYALFGANDEFLRATAIPMKFRASGYETDADVWSAIAEDPSLAVLNGQVSTVPQGFGPPTGELLRLDPIEGGFAPFPLKLRDPGTGKVTTITIIGQMKDSADAFLGLGAGDGGTGVGGIITGKTTVLEAFPDSKGQRFYLALTAGTDSKAYAKSVEAALVQASADSLTQLLDEQQKLQNGFLLVFQGFMGLGLIVGIAALSVVTSRAVVERRQQIGMLRAIGYQRSMVALSFLFEAGFIAISGILLGLALGLSLAWVLFTSGDFGEESKNIDFVVPWLEIGIVCAIAFTAAMVMTYLPARAASKVPIAEALRYE